MGIEIVDTDLFFDGIDCPACQMKVLPGFDPEASNGWDRSLACPHVFLMADDVAIAMLSQQATAVLFSAGAAVADDGDSVVVTRDSEELGLQEVAAILEADPAFREAAILAVYAPAPSFLGSYVGILR